MGAADVAGETEYREHPADRYYIEKDFSFKFNAPVDEKWEITEQKTRNDLFGIPGESIQTIYVDKTGNFAYVGPVTVGGKIERIGQCVGGVWQTWDRHKDTDMFYSWSIEEFFQAHPDELEKFLNSTPSEQSKAIGNSIKNLKSVVMIQCVGSRNEERPYCSRICCSVAIKNALKIKEINQTKRKYFRSC